MIDTGDWPANNGVWNLNNSDLTAFATNTHFGWSLYRTSRYGSGPVYGYTLYLPRFSGPYPASGHGQSVRAPQTITYPSSGLFPDVHFGFDLFEVRFNTDTLVASLDFRFCKWASAVTSTVNGNGAQPDFDLRIYDAASVGDVHSTVTGFIATTGLASSWPVVASRNVLTRAGIGSAYRYNATSLTHNFTYYGVNEPMPANAVIAFRLRDVVAPYTLDRAATTTALEAGIYSGTQDYSATGSGELSLDESVTIDQGSVNQYTSSATDALALSQYAGITVSRPNHHSASASDAVRLSGAGIAAVGRGFESSPQDSLRLLQALTTSSGGDDFVQDSLILSQSATISSDAPEDGGGGTGYIPVLA